MTSIPANLTLIREDFRNPRSLAEIKASMQTAPTDYVMVVGLKDIVDVSGNLVSGVHYLLTHITTRRAFRHTRPLIPYDPVLLIQMNYMGTPILHKSLVHLFPEASVEPWHRVLVRAQLAGSWCDPVSGSHTVVDPWPRPERSGAYSVYRHSIDPDAVMEAVPGVLVKEINQQPFFAPRNPRIEPITVFCRNCSPDFMGSLVAQNVRIETIPAFDFNRMRTSNGSYVAWFDGIEEAVDDQTLSQLQMALEFPGVAAVSPRIIDQFNVARYHHPAFSTLRGIVQGFNPVAWMAHTRGLGLSPPTTGHINNQAIVRKIP